MKQTEKDNEAVDVVLQTADTAEIKDEVKLGANQIAYTKAEETVNIVSHIVGAGLALVGAVLMIIKVCLAGTGTLAIVAVCIYSLSLINLYVMSSLYHAMPLGKRRRAVFRRFDHCSVAFLIAGTYAPYMLIGMVGMGGSDAIWGIVIASVVLATSLLVMVFNAINVSRFKVVCMVCYIVMGWCCVIRIDRLFAMGAGAFWLLLAGGVVYTLGLLIFYRKKTMKNNHAIWHFFVILGSILHFISIYFYII